MTNINNTYTQDIRNSLAGWYFPADDILQALSNRQLLNPSIDLSNSCNLNCPYCYIEEETSIRKIRRENELTIDETIGIIDSMHSFGAKTINIVGAGEPTLDPHFKEVIKYIYDKGLFTVLFTNGILFYHQPSLIDFLYDNNVSIVLKFNSKSSKRQDLIVGRIGYTVKRDRVLDNLIDVGFTAHEPTRLGFDIMVFKGNLSEIPKIHKYCRMNNIFPIAGDYIPTGRTEGGVFHGFQSLKGFSRKERDEIANFLKPITHTEKFKLLKQLADIDLQMNIDRPNGFAYYGGGLCTQLLGLYVDIQGNVWPCVAKKCIINKELISNHLGNIRDGYSIEKAIASDCFKEIYHEYSGACPYKSSMDIGVHFD